MGNVSGTVSFQGVPLAAGVVVFSDSLRGIHVAAAIAADGRYSTQNLARPGLPPGWYDVSVLPPIKELPPEGLDYKQPIELPEHSEIPAKYRDPKTSELKVLIESNEKQNEKQMDIDMLES